MNKIVVNPLLALSVALGTSAIAVLPGMAQSMPVVGYDYSVTGGPLFRAVRINNPPNPAIPLGSTFTLGLPGYADRSITAGVPVDLLTVNLSGFSNLTITGIDPALMLTPSDPFLVGFQFTGSGTATLTKSPIFQNVASVPEPSNLLGLGLLGLGAFLKRQLSKKKQYKKDI